MKKLPKISVESLHKAYEHLLEKLSAKAHQGEALLKQALHDVKGEIKQDASALYDLSADEVVLLETYVKRDLVDATHYLNATGKELKDWLGFDLQLMQQAFLDKFSDAVDKTTAELLQLKLHAANAEYHTGEIVGVGTLACDQCSKTLHFHQPGHIPPCAACKGTVFHRLNA